ncbi:MAG: hypothetical protein R2791_12470 [Saprospiraceae bacterium]
MEMIIVLKIISWLEEGWGQKELCMKLQHVRLVINQLSLSGGIVKAWLSAKNKWRSLCSECHQEALDGTLQFEDRILVSEERALRSILYKVPSGKKEQSPIQFHMLSGHIILAYPKGMYTLKRYLQCLVFLLKTIALYVVQKYFPNAPTMIVRKDTS